MVVHGWTGFVVFSVTYRNNVLSAARNDKAVDCTRRDDVIELSEFDDASFLNFPRFSVEIEFMLR